MLRNGAHVSRLFLCSKTNFVTRRPCFSLTCGVWGPWPVQSWHTHIVRLTGLCSGVALLRCRHLFRNDGLRGPRPHSRILVCLLVAFSSPLPVGFILFINVLCHYLVCSSRRWCVCVSLRPVYFSASIPAGPPPCSDRAFLALGPHPSKMRWRPCSAFL